MQKKIIALSIVAAFAAPAAAMADASLYGSLDAGYGSSKNTAGISTTGMTTGTYATNNWGIKGSEDLGDGMKANFQMESGFATNSGDGNAIGDRGIALGVSAGWGGIMLGGNQYTTSFKVNKNFDPMGYKYIGVTGMALVAAGNKGRNDNDVAYTGKFGDITVMGGKTFNPSVDGNAVGDATSIGAVYSAGDLTAGASYTSTDKSVVQAAVTAANGGQFGAIAANAAAVANTNMSLGAAYKFGDAKVSALYVTSKNDGATDSTNTTVIGATFNVSNKIGVGAAMYKSTFGSTDISNRNLLSATYALSKSTTMYADYTTESVASTSGYGIGLQVGF